MREELLKAMIAEARTDAKVSAFLSQELESIETEIYRKEYPQIKFRQFAPVDNNLPAGVETISYRVYDMFGQAKILANYAEDLPEVAVRGEKHSTTVEGIGMGYSYSTHDLRAAAMSGFALDREEANAAREFIERKMDSLTALGNKKFGFKGMLKFPGVPVDTAAATGSGSSTEWKKKTPANILLDMHALVQAQVDATKEIHPPDTMLLPPSLYGYISTTPMSDENGTTILQRFLATNPYISQVSSWVHLDTANETGYGPRAMVYQRTPRVIQVKIPMEVLQHDPERVGLRFKIPMESRYGGVVVRLPLAMRYLDGI